MADDGWGFARQGHWRGPNPQPPAGVMMAILQRQGGKCAGCRKPLAAGRALAQLRGGCRVAVCGGCADEDEGP